MNDGIQVSVLIVNWNACRHLARCLQSLADQKIAHEVIVLDNASTDDSVAMIRSKFPGVQLVVGDRNFGFAAGNNRAARQARGRYLLLLNPDTRVQSGALHNLVSYADAHPSIAALGPELVNPDGSHQRSCWRGFPGLRMAFADAFYLWKIGWLPFGNRSEYSVAELRAPRAVDHLLGACMLIRRAAWEVVGGLDENYFLFLEETDWCMRAQHAGWKIVYYPHARVTHFGQASMRQEPHTSIPQFYKSYLYFYRAHHGSNSPGALALKGIIAVACIIRIGMWRERAARARDAANREIARGMTIGYRQTLSELGTY